MQRETRTISKHAHTHIHTTCIETCTVEAHSVAEISSFSAFRFSHDDARVRTCAKLKRLVRSQPRAFHQLFSTLDVFASMDIFQTRSFFFSPSPTPRINSREKTLCLCLLLPLPHDKSNASVFIKIVIYMYIYLYIYISIFVFYNVKLR